jgi:hypothetical protein
LYATFLINRVYTPLLDHKSPYQLLHDSIPDKSVFKVFGSLCYASTLLSHRTKLDPRARKSVFLGYKSGYKGFVLYDLNTKEILSLDMSHSMNIFYLTRALILHSPLLGIIFQLPLTMIFLPHQLPPLTHQFSHLLTFLTFTMTFLPHQLPHLPHQLSHLLTLTLLLLLHLPILVSPPDQNIHLHILRTMSAML